MALTILEWAVHLAIKGILLVLLPHAPYWPTCCPTVFFVWVEPSLSTGKVSGKLSKISAPNMGHGIVLFSN